jgi:hypothetical protein
MKKLLLALLVFVLALPSVASAVKPSGPLVGQPDSAADSGTGAAPKSWLFNNVFVVRAHICRPTGTLLCGPDPLISSGFSYGSVTRIWVPFNDTYTIYGFVMDVEGNVVDLKSGSFFINGNSYFNTLATWAPLPDGLYKFQALIIANGSGLITFSEFYHFRVGGPGSGGCCP